MAVSFPNAPPPQCVQVGHIFTAATPLHCVQVGHIFERSDFFSTPLYHNGNEKQAILYIQNLCLPMTAFGRHSVRTFPKSHPLFAGDFTTCGRNKKNHHNKTGRNVPTPPYLIKPPRKTGSPFAPRHSKPSTEQPLFRLSFLLTGLDIGSYSPAAPRQCGNCA